MEPAGAQESPLLGHEWCFKGEGNANVVFGYTGTDSKLAGLVLRLRKAHLKPHAQLKDIEELERLIWLPAIPAWDVLGGWCFCWLVAV